MKQVELRQDDGWSTIAWIDKEHATVGLRLDLHLGEGHRSAPMTIVNVWETERDGQEIQERQTARRDFGGSIR